MIEIFSKVIIPILGLILISVVMTIQWNESHPPKVPPCDTCKHLKIKRKDYSAQYYRYECRASESGCGFDEPPEICGDYDPKEDNPGEASL